MRLWGNMSRLFQSGLALLLLSESGESCLPLLRSQEMSRKEGTSGCVNVKPQAAHLQHRPL